MSLKAESDGQVVRRVGLDFDGVIVDHSANLVELAYQELGLTLEQPQVNMNILSRHVAREVYRQCLAGRLYREMMLTAPPVDGSLEALARLPGNTVIVSSRPADFREAAKRWLTTFGFGHMMRQGRVWFVDRNEDKAVCLVSLGVTDYLDDKLSVLESLPDSVRCWLFDQHDIAELLDIPPDIEVVPGWPDFVAGVNG